MDKVGECGVSTAGLRALGGMGSDLDLRNPLWCCVDQDRGPWDGSRRAGQEAGEARGVRLG